MRDDKKIAIRLRKQGKSYNEIVNILGTPKSTLSLWLRSIKMPTGIKRRLWNKTRIKQAKNITEFNKKRVKIAREKAEKIQENASQDIGMFSKKELLLVGTALYWAEGHKKTRWALQFSNSDPSMIKVMMQFLKKVCGIPKGKIRAIVQIHPNVTSKKAINYWSGISGIPKTQFAKCYCRLTPTSKKKRPHNTLPFGTIRVEVYDTHITNRVKGWIRGIIKQN